MEEDDGRGEDKASEDLNADDDELQREVRDEDDGCGRKNAECVDRVEAWGFGGFLMEGVLPAGYFSIGPGAGEGDGRGAEDGRVDHEEKDGVMEKDAAAMG